ncbi:MAG: serine/threonine-protein kinase [Polyangiales bacterium]
MTLTVPDADEAPEFELPRRFGRYVLFDRIGRGGMAEIYLARGTTQMGAARLAVVKLVLDRFSSDPGFSEMLVSEAKLAAGLSHANIVQTFDLGREEGRLFIAMEYVEGFDLTKLVKNLAARKIGLPAEYGFYAVMETLRALDYAHRRTDDQGHALGIVHRDVSPSNVLISLEGEAKLCDFGIARALDDLNEVPEGALEGKAAYMSPEHARGERVDGRADVFSASVILWEILAGRRMYKKPPNGEVIDLARAGDVPPLPARGFPRQERLQEILSKGLAKNRDDRYPTAGAMLRDLEEYVVEAKLHASPMRFGAFLTEQFETELVAVRRAREQAALSVTIADPVEVIPVLALPSSMPPPPPPPPEPEPEPVLPPEEPPAPAYPAYVPSARPPLPDFVPPPPEEPRSVRPYVLGGVVALLLVLAAAAAVLTR